MMSFSFERTSRPRRTHARGGVPFVRDDARSENPVGTTREAADRRARARRKAGKHDDG